MDADGLIVWSTPAATCGLVVVGGDVVDGPPYAVKVGLVGRDAREVWREQARRGVDLEWVPNVAETQIPDHTFFRLDSKVMVGCWRTGVHGGWDQRHVRYGWLPDGRWWVERTGDRYAWLYHGWNQRGLRAAAEAKAAELRDEDSWERAPVVYRGREVPDDQVPQWPPDREPSEAADQR